MKTLFAVLAVFFAFNNTAAQPNDFKWLVGTWKVEGQNVFEVWRSESVEGLTGKSFLINGTDTVVTETISLKFYDGTFHYIPDVAGDQPPIDFRITSFDGESFVAENPQHDFPKIIRYRHVMKHGKAFIEAAIEGDGTVVPYSFRKVK